MTIHHLIASHAEPVGPETGPLFSVRLVDRRTGSVPKLNGIPLAMMTRQPKLAVTNLMRGRNRAVWRAEIEPVEMGVPSH